MEPRDAAAFLTVSDVAALLGVGISRVRQLDAVLVHVRDSTNRRLYERSAVEALAAQRAASKASR